MSPNLCHVSVGPISSVEFYSGLFRFEYAKENGKHVERSTQSKAVAFEPAIVRAHMKPWAHSPRSCPTNFFRQNLEAFRIGYVFPRPHIFPPLGKVRSLYATCTRVGQTCFTISCGPTH